MARRILKSSILNASEEAIKNKIDGLSVDVLTWGEPLAWKRVRVNHEAPKGFHEEKRDQYHKRSELCDRLQRAGQFEVSVAYAPSIEGAKDSATVQSGINKGKRKIQYSVKCSLCGSGHNWCVFYRSLDGEYLGHSGIPCFEEVLSNIHIDRSEAVLAEVKRNKNRADKYARTMRRINDFKRDFPGLYEHRGVLGDSRKNPYSRLWRMVPNRLQDSRGVDEAFLAEVEEGKHDWAGKLTINPVTNKYERQVDQTARRLPKFLKWASSQMQQTGGDIDNLLEQIRVTHERDEADKVAKAEAKAAGVEEAKVEEDDSTPLQVRAKVLLSSGSAWLKCVKKAANGETVSTAQQTFIHARYNALRAVQGAEKINKAIDAAVLSTLEDDNVVNDDGYGSIECGDNA